MRRAFMLTPTDTNDVVKTDFSTVDFDEWMALYQQDPEAFEQRRADLIQSAISRAPKHHQRRLNGLQFQVDMERRRTHSPLKCCLRVSALMWEKFDTLRANLNELSDQQYNTATVQRSETQPHNADILPFSPQ